ncbi:hypothetical protein C8R43DRAFT_959237 [Mycena crocata]|nr:hypothetical protein C8R43DRAFT_959237 [Mycena crocata]
MPNWVLRTKDSAAASACLKASTSGAVSGHTETGSEAGNFSNAGISPRVTRELNQIFWFLPEATLALGSQIQVAKRFIDPNSLDAKQGPLADRGEFHPQRVDSQTTAGNTILTVKGSFAR